MWLPIFYTKRYIEQYNKFEIKHVLCILKNKIYSNRNMVNTMNDSGTINIMSDFCHITYSYRGETYKYFCTGKPRLIYPKKWKKCDIKNVHSINMENTINDITDIFKMYMGPYNKIPKTPNKIFNTKQIIICLLYTSPSPRD